MKNLTKVAFDFSPRRGFESGPGDHSFPTFTVTSCREENRGVCVSTSNNDTTYVEQTNIYIKYSDRNDRRFDLCY